MMKGPFSRKQLYASNGQRTYTHQATQAAFLLGGIGTGNVSLAANGELRDWEIFNRPGKGVRLPYSFFAIWARKPGGKPVAKVLEAPLEPPFVEAHGIPAWRLGGLPRLDGSLMRGEYPFVWIDFQDAALPVRVRLEAFTPFIPLNADDSSIPGAVIRYYVKNAGSKPVDVTIAGTLPNAVGYTGKDNLNNQREREGLCNEYRQDGPLKGLLFANSKIPFGSITGGTMALLTAAGSVTHKRKWLNDAWWDGAHDFWDDFAADGRLEPEPTYGQIQGAASFNKTGMHVGSLGIRQTIKPKQEKVFEFLLAWHFPNRAKQWSEDCGPDCGCGTTRMYYAKLFYDAWAAGKYLHENLPRLEAASRAFHDALFSSTLPGYVIDALQANITVLRSPTCFRLENGTFAGWEGCNDHGGCCHGSCTHVWNYAQTLAFLFPQLEQSMRRVEFQLETDEQGRMRFRSERVFGREPWKFAHPAADGQNGTIVRLYREWKLTGDDAFLKDLWPQASKALDFAFEYWDSDKDFVLDSQQHNTYDIEFYGPNSLCNSMFFAALKAAAEMAEHLRDAAHAARYRQALEKGSKRMDQLLWNGQYYVQRIEDVDAYRYQYGPGCLADQMLGQYLAHVVGLGHILPKEHVKKALRSIFQYNFRPTLADHDSVQRTYALNDEMGLLLCTWPRGGRPRIPFPYCDEVWPGFEYQVAAHLIYEGLVEEGLTIVKAVRDRHDGVRRNPWDEVECGHHYARSMASWAVLTALSGFKFDMVKGTMSFAPAINKDNFTCFWSTGKAWGTYAQKKTRSGKLDKKVRVLYGSLEGVKVEAATVDKMTRWQGEGVVR
jgi:non-lysosomal glucosylceramidase